jgi:DNA/RNA endonuclease YhcR with UshA esterase domain
MTTRSILTAVFAALVLVSGPGHAHHSFAVHYDSNKVITKKGVVTQVRFTNPHGILMLDVTNEKGKTESWTVETTAPVYLRRSGWTKDAIKVGDQVIVEGWASRDGSRLMRVRTVKRPDGTTIGNRSQEAGDQ